MVGVAWQLYRLEHGSEPEQLAQLVPGYLDWIPGDLFADGASLQYLRRPDGQRLVYSIGPDGQDQRGEELVDMDNPERGGDIALILGRSVAAEQSAVPVDSEIGRTAVGSGG